MRSELMRLKRDTVTGRITVASAATLPARDRPSWHTKATLAVAAAAALAVLSITWLYLTQGHVKTFDSVAVLPFANAGGDASMEYLSDGITESLIGSLSQIPRLRVIAPSTVFTYKGRKLEPHKIGQELKVAAVVQGKVTKLGETLVIEADLVNAVDDTELWGEHYRRKMGDVFAVQSDIAREIADKLRLHLTGEEEKRLTKHYTESPEAYQLYLKGLYNSKQFSKEGLEKGSEYFRQAIDKDPNYALAYDGLAYNYGVVVDWLVPPRDAMPRTKMFAEKALEVDDTLGDAHNWLGAVYFWYDYNPAAAEKEFKRALELSPNDAEAHGIYGWYLVAMKRFDEGIAESERGRN